MKIGDKVRHISIPNFVGVVAEFGKKPYRVLVNLSDRQGVKFRWCHINKLIIIDE